VDPESLKTMASGVLEKANPEVLKSAFASLTESMNPEQLKDFFTKYGSQLASSGA